MESKYIYDVCYIDALVYHFWFSLFVPVDSSYHLVSFSSLVFPPTSFGLLSVSVLRLYMLHAQYTIADCCTITFYVG